MKLSVITLNYNKFLLTSSCIASLYKQFQEQFEKGEVEVIIVDNKSHDDSLQQLKSEISKKKYKNVHLLENTTNAGFGAGNNFGARKAKGEYVVFLNNDTTVEDKGIWEMVEYISKHKEVGILGGKLTNIDGSNQVSVGKFYNFFSLTLLLFGLQRIGLIDNNPKKIQKVDWVKGGLLMMGRDNFEKLHGFDEKIFMYTEDMELCFRARKLGINSYFYPAISVLHAEHGSTNRTFAIVHIYQGILYFYKKHKPIWQLYLLQLMLKSKAYILIALGKALGNNYLVTTYEEALAVV